MQFVGIEHVNLVEHQYDRYAVCLGRGEKTVDKGGAGLRHLDGDDEHSLVDVGCKDATLLGEVRRFADDIVLSVLNVGNPRVPVIVSVPVKYHPIAHGNRIGATNALEAEVAFHLAVNRSTIVGEHCVPVARILYYKSFQVSVSVLALQWVFLLWQA